jgi:hypothetical protein
MELLGFPGCEKIAGALPRRRPVRQHTVPATYFIAIVPGSAVRRGPAPSA